MRSLNGFNIQVQSTYLLQKLRLRSDGLLLDFGHLFALCALSWLFDCHFPNGFRLVLFLALFDIGSSERRWEVACLLMMQA